MLSFENMNPIATNMYPIPCRDWKGYISSIHYLDKIYWVDRIYSLPLSRYEDTNQLVSSS